MFEKLMRGIARLRPSRELRDDGDIVRDRKQDARMDLLDGRGMTPGGGKIDFESDSKHPR